MNYPVWQLGIPGGLLIAFVAVTHVFVSHFAVGGGAFLVLTERRAHRIGDLELLGWVRRHSKFFALLTLVFGAVSGVGIWFTIGLVAPEATSSLIHTFVWAWAIEWVFFVVEIAAAIIYATCWDRLDRRSHMIVGWIYFWAAFFSLVVINGIITYQLTPGRWLQTKNFWDGFFNPTYLPSLFIRTAMCIVLAGVFGLITAVREKPELRARVARLAGAWIVTGSLMLPLFAWWYFAKFPDFSKTYATGAILMVRHTIRGGIAFTLVVLLMALVFALWKPRLMRAPVVALLVLFAFGMMASGEYLREFVRKPWVINGYIYANDVRVSSVTDYAKRGVFGNAAWVTAADPKSVDYGHDLFVMQCSKCHTVDGYRAIRPRVRNWDATFAANMLGHLEMMKVGTMPRFAGDERDRAALGLYLASLNPHPPAQVKNIDGEGKQVFETRCGSCHTIDGKIRPLKAAFTDSTPEQIEAILPVLSTMSDNMPPFTGTDEEAKALAHYAAKAANTPAAR